MAAAQIFIVCGLLGLEYIITYLKDWKSVTIPLPLHRNILRPLPHPPGLRNLSHQHSFASLGSIEPHWCLLSDSNHCICWLGLSLICCHPLQFSIHWRCCCDQTLSSHRWSPANQIYYCVPRLSMYRSTDQRQAKLKSCCYGLRWSWSQRDSPPRPDCCVHSP